MTGSGRGAIRVVVVNTVALNAGDAAILLGLVSALREAFGPSLELAVADDQPEAAQRLYPELRIVPGFYPRRAGERPLARSARRRRIGLALRIARWWPWLGRRLLDRSGRAHFDRLASADAVISTGGTYFVEHYAIYRRAAELLTARALGTPTFLYTQSLGPFERGSSRRLMGRVVSGARLTFLRDQRSFDHLVELGIDPGALVIRPDPAFALVRPQPGPGSGPGPGATPARGGSGGPKRVAISVRHWQYFQDRTREEGLATYRRSVAAVARRLHERGAEVVFLSTCQGVDAYWTDDSRFARRLVDEHLSDLTGVRVDTLFRRPEALLEELTTFDMVVATRMHFAILALCAGVPVVPIAYEFKTRELFAGLGMEELVTDMDTITPEALGRAVDRAVGSLPELSDHILKAVSRLAPLALEPARMIRDALPDPEPDNEHPR